MHTVKFTQQVSDKQIEWLMEEALKGCTYWADDALVFTGPTATGDPDKVDDFFPSEALTNGYNLKIHDTEENKWHLITLNDLLTAIGESRIDMECYDMYAAEEVLQRAIFGEVVYG